MTKNVLQTRLFGVYLRIDETRGWWFSLGLHLDFQHRSIDLHFLWWIVTIGDPMNGRDVDREGQFVWYEFGPDRDDYGTWT